MLALLSVEPEFIPTMLSAPATISLTQAVDADPLPWTEVHHLALKREVVALPCTAHDPLPWRAHHLDPEVVQLEGVIRGR